MPPGKLIQDLLEQGLVTGLDPRRLSGGRTNLLWLLPNEKGSERVLKLFRATVDNPLFPNECTSECSALISLKGSGLAPDLVAHGSHAGQDWILYDHVPGRASPSDPARVAKALAHVHAQTPWPGLRESAVGSAALREQGQCMLETCAPDDRTRLSHLCPTHAVAPPANRHVIHADPVPSNIVERTRGITFIDWQCPALGDPCEDLAIYLSPAMQWLYTGAILTPEDTRRCLEAYTDRKVVDRYGRIAPWYHWRNAAYCAWQAARAQGDYRTALDLELAALDAAR
ncbi:MAG: phosphotransferase [Pseudomonadota bacterium]